MTSAEAAHTANQQNAARAVICLEHVSKGFGRHEVLKDVSFEIGQGEAFGIVGKSGTGKSVTLKLMIGLLSADRGRILIDGKDLHELDRKSLLETRKRVGFLFQMAALFDSLSVFENVAFPLRRHTHKRENEIREIVQKSLDSVGLGADARKMPVELSGGMRKRVGLARALILEPPIVLVDEPGTGLDVITASEIYDLLRKLNEQGKTLVVVTHDGMAMHGIVNDMVVLDEGNVIGRGSPKELSESGNKLVRTLLSGRGQTG